MEIAGRVMALLSRKRVRGTLEHPGIGGGVADEIHVVGWVFSPRACVTHVEVLIGDTLLGTVPCGRERSDVSRVYAHPNAARSGYNGIVRIPPTIAPGEHSLTVVATDACAGVWTCRRRIRLLVSATESSGLTGEVEKALMACRDRSREDLSILDWDTGFALQRLLPAWNVFSPLASGCQLPYLDRSIDVVVLAADNPQQLDEAKRVARLAVVRAASGSDGCSVTLVAEEDVARGDSLREVSVSIVIPVHNGLKYTEACLHRVQSTLGADFRGEIIVVDDASTDATPEALRTWAAEDTRLTIVRNDQNVGFGASCNRGVSAATGDIIVFLNNDTLPQAGWLRPLVRLLCERSDAGAVGGRLVYPDGTLQEAGGIVFSDGSAWNFGRHDERPRAPAYSHLREVDYCSGALLATWRSLFVALGGFDARFAPAYYEDVDFCFTVRRAGRRVYYQPASTIVHVEGATAGTRPDDAVKRYQTINQPKFAEKWRSVLVEQPDRPEPADPGTVALLASRDRAAPRALVWAPGPPEHDREGGSQRVWHLIEFLREAGWVVTFVARNANRGQRYFEALQQLGVAAYAGPESASAGDGYLDDVDRLVADGRFDVAILAFWFIGEEISPRLRALSPDTKVIIDSIDLHFLRNARRVLRPQPADRELDQEFADAMRRELNTYARAAAVLTVSQKEADMVNDLTGRPGLARCVPLMEDVNFSPTSFAERQGVLFIGNFRHDPNVEGLEYLCQEVLPRLDPGTLTSHPVSVVGNAVDDRVRRIVEGVRGVRLVGWVPSLIPYLSRARVSVIPLLHGAGSKTKLIKALMAGLPSVSTTIGIEGLGLRDEHVRVADDPAAFAGALEELLQDAEGWRRMATAGHAHIVALHGRAAVRSRFLGVISDLLQERGQARASGG